MKECGGGALDVYARLTSLYDHPPCSVLLCRRLTVVKRQEEGGREGDLEGPKSRSRRCFARSHAPTWHLAPGPCSGVAPAGARGGRRGHARLRVNGFLVLLPLLHPIPSPIPHTLSKNAHCSNTTGYSIVSCGLLLPLNTVLRTRRFQPSIDTIHPSSITITRSPNSPIRAPSGRDSR